MKDLAQNEIFVNYIVDICIANFQAKSEAEQKFNNPNIPKTELQNNYIPLEVQKTAACVVNSY